MMDTARTIDTSVLRRLTARPGTTKADIIERTAALADDVKPWLVGTPVLLIVRRRPAAVGRAWLALAFAAGTSGIASAIIGRDRPAGVVRDRTRAADEPSSGSMPSTHTASATAFVTSLMVDDPWAASALVPVLGFVAWSRVAAARHYPSDVAAGVVVGVVAAGTVAMPAVWLRRRTGRRTRGGR